MDVDRSLLRANGCSMAAAPTILGRHVLLHERRRRIKHKGLKRPHIKSAATQDRWFVTENHLTRVLQKAPLGLASRTKEFARTSCSAPITLRAKGLIKKMPSLYFIFIFFQGNVLLQAHLQARTPNLAI